MTDPLRFLFFGAGAIGTYIGGSLASVGYPTVFLERPEIARELRDGCLRIRRGDSETVLEHPQVCESLAEVFSQGGYDFAFLAVKSFDTRIVTEQLKPWSDRLPVIVSLQNGVENEALVRSILGEGRVIAGTVTSAVGRRGAGDVVLERLRGMGIAATHPRSVELVDALNRAGLQAKLLSSEPAMKWSKMLTNLTANATSAILNMTPAEIYADPIAFGIDQAQMREALAVMRARRIKVVNLPGVPVTLMAFAVQYLPKKIAQALLARAVGRGRGDKMPSFHIDLHAGRGQSEVDYLNGAVVRLGKESGVAAPVNAALTETLTRLTSGELQKGIFDHHPEQLLRLIQEN